MEKNEFGRCTCPAGCDKTFLAGAAIKHGTKCVQDLRKRRRGRRASAPLAGAEAAARGAWTAPRRRRRGRRRRNADLERDSPRRARRRGRPPDEDDRAVDLAAVERPATRWHECHPDSTGTQPQMHAAAGYYGARARARPGQAAARQDEAQGPEPAPRGRRDVPGVGGRRRKLAAGAKAAHQEAARAARERRRPRRGRGRGVVGPSRGKRQQWARRVATPGACSRWWSNLLDDEKKRELRAVGQRLKGANGGRAPLPDLVRETVALVGSERWSFAVAEAARRQSRDAPPLPSQSRSAPPPLPAAVVSPPTSLPVAWAEGGLDRATARRHLRAATRRGRPSQTLTEAADAAVLQAIELRSCGAPVALCPVPAVQSIRECHGPARRSNVHGAGPFDPGCSRPIQGRLMPLDRSITICG